MKRTGKLICVVMVLLCLCSCVINSTSGISGDKCEFLTDAVWEGRDGQCTSTIAFGEDGSFSNHCTCGEHIGDADLAERFVYSMKENGVFLYDSQDKVVAEGNIVYVDDVYLVIRLWDSIFVYENTEEHRPVVTAAASAIIGTDETTKPFLFARSYDGENVKVTAYDYDGDTPDLFEDWVLPASDNVKFTEVIVVINNGVESMTVTELRKSDEKHIGEYYTGGYFDINENGEVESIVFYGETIIEG